MAAFVKNRWVLFLVLIVFILCKVPHLHYPYYWDESWPYAVAIRDMYLHGISLMPAAIDPELSRGHPLLFHLLAACWMHIFGNSHISMHSFALTISVLFMVAIYEAGLKLFNKRAAIMSMVLVATQVVFFVQSSYVLFEMLVAFLAFLSLYFYVRQKYFLTALFLSALFYTKESGLIMGFVLGMAACIGLFDKKMELKKRMYQLISVAIPCVLIGIFFLIQKHIRGWYIFPFYNNLIEHNWDSFWYNFRHNGVKNTFYAYLKYYYFLLLLAVSLIAAIKNKSFKYLAFFLPAIIIYYFVDDMRAGRPMPSFPFFISFILSIMLMLYLLKQLKIYRDTQQEQFIVLSCFFIFCFFCFSSMNFFTYRYLLPSLIPLFFFTAVIFDKFIERTYPVLYYPALLLMLVISFFAFKTDEGYGDADIHDVDGMDVQQSVVDYMEKMNYYDKNIGSGSFLERQHLFDPATGFLHSDKTFKKLDWSIDRYTEIAIFDNLEPDNRYESYFNRDSSFHRVFRNQKGKVWAEIYLRER